MVFPRYWADEHEVKNRLARRGWTKEWLFGWRDTGRSADERTVICSILPRTAVSNKLPLALTGEYAELFAAMWTSFIFDYIARQKVAGATLNFFLVKQFPVLQPAIFQAPIEWLSGAAVAGWVRSRVLELSYTAYDLATFAADLGDNGAPFRWDDERRFWMRAELDAAFFHLYGVERDDVDYIMETFPVVKRRDEERYGAFRTKELILEIYDAMAEAARTGKPYQTILDPLPGQGPRHG